MAVGDITIAATDGGSFGAYLVEPAQGAAPGLVLMQYICGVNRVMRALADDFAARGFLVVVPDLFWRQEPDIQLINDPASPSPDEQKRAFELNDGFDDDNATLDLRATLDHLRGHPDCTGRVGALGYCLGGRLAYLVAARTDADCAVGYYGVNVDHYLDQADNIANPLLLHMAGNDALCSTEAHEAIVARLGPMAGVALEQYPGVGHAFALVGGPNYDSVAADRANERSNAFLAQHLN